VKNFPQISGADTKYFTKFHEWFSRSEDIKFHRKKHDFGYISHYNRAEKLTFLGWGFLMVPSNFQ